MMLNPLFCFEECGPDVSYDPCGLGDESAVNRMGGASDDMWSSYGLYPSNDPIEKVTSFQLVDSESATATRQTPPVLSLEEMGGRSRVVNDLWASCNFYHSSPLHKATTTTTFNSTNDSQSFQDLMAVDDALDKSLLTGLSELFSPKEKAIRTPFSSLGLLMDYRTSHNRLDGEIVSSLSDRSEATQSETGRSELSTEELMRVAAAHFIQLSSPKDVIDSSSSSSIQSLPFPFPFWVSLSSLLVEDMKNAELASLLLAAAEKVTNQMYDRANKLLRQCHMLSSTTGNPVQRVVHYFSHALQERIDRETGLMKGGKAKGTMKSEEVIKVIQANHPPLLQLICHETLPFNQILQFTSIQAIIDNVATSTRIHMIDLSIQHGLQWTVLIQALATRSSCPVESLKISAVGLAEELVLATGKRLSSFAESLGLPFEFKAVVTPDIKDLRKDMFELTEGEVVGIYSEMDMNSMIVRPESLENLMRVVWKLKPCVMTIIDVEAKHNSPSFINRFTEALFYYSAVFDCMDNVMERTDENRTILEGSFFSQGIASIVASEGSERVVRHVGVSVWREFFARFGFVEADLNEYSTYQAGLLLKLFVCGDSYTLEKDGKSLLIGWKGTPMYFVSAWKFQRVEKT